MKCRFYLFLISACSLLFLLGCEPVSEANKFETYLERVNRVLELPSSSLPNERQIALPNKRSLTVELTPITLGLLESYELRKCGLFQLIAERNSVLGKVQDPFRELDFQLSLLKGLSQCLSDDSVSQPLKLTLKNIEKAKYQQLPGYLTNTVFASDAFRRQLSQQHWITQGNSQVDTGVINGLSTLTQIQLGQWDKELKSIVTYQESIEKAVVLGPLTYSLINSARYLQAITQRLELAENSVICQQGRDKTKFNYLKNVFQSQYVQVIQPYMSDLDSLYYQVAPFLNLLSHSAVDYRYPLVEAHEQFRLETQAHIQFWKSLFKRCGHTPSR